MVPVVLLAVAALQDSPALHATKRATALLGFVTRVEDGDDQGPAEAEEKQAALEALASEVKVAAPEKLGEVRRLAVAIAAGDRQHIAAAGAALASELRRKSAWEAVPRSRPDLKRGARLYAQACAACHGAGGRPPAGNPLGLATRPPAFADPAEARRLSPHRIFESVTAGVPGTSMPGFDEALSERDRWSLAFYVQALSHELPAPRPARPPALSLRDAALSSDELLGARLEAAGVPGPDVEAAIAAMRWSPPSHPEAGPSPVIIPGWLLSASLRRDSLVRQGDALRNEIDVVLSGPAERSRLRALVNLVARQAFLRISLPVTELRVDAWPNEEALRSRGEPIASCSLLPAGGYECAVAPPERFADASAVGEPSRGARHGP